MSSSDPIDWIKQAKKETDWIKDATREADALARAAAEARRAVDQPHPWIPGAVFNMSDQLKPELIKALDRMGRPAEEISDGCHTFGELYDHRRALTAVLAVVMTSALPGSAWRSKQHHPDDDPMFEGGYFIVGLRLATGTITYHYELAHWDDFRCVPELPHAPKWDGATPAATVHRLIRAATVELTEA